MKLAEIITRVQRQFGDEMQAQITKEDIVRWVNDACLEIVNQNSAHHGTLANTNTVPGKSQYELPADLMRIRSVRVGGFKLVGTTYEQVSDQFPYMATDSGTPTHYWVYDGMLNLYPTPVGEEQIGVLYVKTPDIMNINMLEKQPDVSIVYHPRIVEYCIAQAAELDDNLGHYQFKMQQFKSNINESSGNAETPESDEFYPSITYIGG